MRTVALITLALLGLAGCSKKETPVVVLASDADGQPQFAYVGPGMYKYDRNFSSFTFKVGPVSGQPWVTGSGEMKFGDSNDLVMTIESEADRAFDIRVLGMLTNNNMQASEDRTVELFHIPSGKHAFKVERFVIYRYRQQ
jgi:hypothetical protein